MAVAGRIVRLSRGVGSSYGLTGRAVPLALAATAQAPAVSTVLHRQYPWYNGTIVGSLTPCGRSGDRCFSASAAVEESFQSALKRLEASTASPDNETKLKMYGLFKQATKGPCEEAEPSMFNPIAKAKWGAWNALQQMPKEDAMTAYVEVVEGILAKEQPKNDAAAAKSQNKADKPGDGLISVNVDDDGVATVYLDSITCPPEWFQAVEGTMLQIEEDPRVKVVVIRSGMHHKHFSYGLDLPKAGASLMAIKMGGPRNELYTLIRDWQDAFTSIAKCSKPVITSVSGWCIGAGLEMISAADIRICSADAKFSLKEAELGIVADLGGLQRLPPIIGEGPTRHLALTACNIDANRALQLNLVTEVHEDQESLHRHTAEMARKMAQMDAECLKGIKNVMEYGQNKTVDEGLQYVAAWNSSFLNLEAVGGKVMAMMAAAKKKA